MFRSEDIQVFAFFDHSMIYQISDVMMAFLNISFEPHIMKSPNLVC